jgi:hypothetical protein
MILGMLIRVYTAGTRKEIKKGVESDQQAIQTQSMDVPDC